jgi:carotenoid cleavage dioxygenase-like enzyme
MVTNVAVFNTLLKFDTETGKTARHDFGNQIVGEAAFVPKPGGRREDDGSWPRSPMTRCDRQAASCCWMHAASQKRQWPSWSCRNACRKACTATGCPGSEPLQPTFQSI